MRPRDAASILVLDRQTASVKVLVGRRSSRHVFMPDVHVFPGGRRDRRDHAIVCGPDLQPDVLDRLKSAAGPRAGDARMRALALAAIRELHEETGLSLGASSGDGNEQANGSLPFLPDLSNLRYIARAITPPGHPRRFDTRFFAVFADETGLDTGMLCNSDELDDLRWIDVNDTSSVKMPDITEIILGELNSCLRDDPSLPFGRPVPFYYTRRGRFVRDLI
ncbi:NUDIX hydrolase [Pararhizobium sp.]|uniref:NUDIX hydrolase n=1 Tax=Pararhizobium sp. TaxID=1977563 RepID=UPI002717EC03|nr:hydrolase [Pararhizobium sp.]MDO9415898.1 NUDIX domain-containing protein [Pararhizobium sp.]